MEDTILRVSDVDKHIGILNDFGKHRTNGNGEINNRNTEIQAWIRPAGDRRFYVRKTAKTGVL